MISDEAHRTQYGRLVLNMRKALPKAKFIGFTGTPLIEEAEKQLTRQVFGDYVSIYDFQPAVADKATLPLLYENRGEKLKIVDPTVNERIAKRIDAARRTATMEDPWTEEKLYRELARDYPIHTSPTRLDKVAQDFVDHYHQRWRVVENGGGKAMMVCLDKITCVKMHGLIVDKWQNKIEQLEKGVAEEETLFAAKGKPPDKLLLGRREHVEWMKATEACVVVSQEQGEVADFKKWTNFKNEPLNIVPHREKVVKRELEIEFKKSDHPFRIAIICAMWLTGFDVKCLATLYLDKPMKSHTLMQAIARVNRVGGGKKHGLIIDYNGRLKSLRQALATFAQGGRKGGGEKDAVREDSEALAEYAASLKQAKDFLGGLNFELGGLTAAGGFEKQRQILTPVNLLCETDERRKTYEVIVEDIQARHRGLFPHQGLFAYNAKENAVGAIYNKLQDARESADVSALLQSLYEVVDKALTTDGTANRAVGNQTQKQYDLSNINFARLRAEFERTPYKNVVILNLKEQIEKRLAMILARNPTRIDLYGRYQEIVKEYNKDKDDAEIQKVLDDLTATMTSLDEEGRRYLREGLDNEDQLAVFALLQKESLNKSDRDSIEEIAVELLEKLNNGQIQIQRLKEIATVQAKVKAEIIKHLFANMPSGVYDADEISVKTNAVFAHIYTAGLGDGVQVYH